MKAFGILLLGFGLPVLAQEHQHNSAIIKGHEHLDQISDSDAYRLFFLIPVPKTTARGSEEQERIA